MWMTSRSCQSGGVLGLKFGFKAGACAGMACNNKSVSNLYYFDSSLYFKKFCVCVCVQGCVRVSLSLPDIFTTHIHSYGVVLYALIIMGKQHACLHMGVGTASPFNQFLMEELLST